MNMKILIDKIKAMVIAIASNEIDLSGNRNKKQLRTYRRNPTTGATSNKNSRKTEIHGVGQLIHEKRSECENI